MTPIATSTTRLKNCLPRSPVLEIADFIGQFPSLAGISDLHRQRQDGFEDLVRSGCGGLNGAVHMFAPAKFWKQAETVSPAAHAPANRLGVIGIPVNALPMLGCLPRGRAVNL